MSGTLFSNVNNIQSTMLEDKKHMFNVNVNTITSVLKDTDFAGSITLHINLHALLDTYLQIILYNRLMSILKQSNSVNYL